MFTPESPKGIKTLVLCEYISEIWFNLERNKKSEKKQQQWELVRLSQSHPTAGYSTVIIIVLESIPVG